MFCEFPASKVHDEKVEKLVDSLRSHVEDIRLVALKEMKRLVFIDRGFQPYQNAIARSGGILQMVEMGCGTEVSTVFVQKQCWETLTEMVFENPMTSQHLASIPGVLPKMKELLLQGNHLLRDKIMSTINNTLAMIKQIPDEWGGLIEVLCKVFQKGRHENSIWVWQKFSLYPQFLPIFRKARVHIFLLDILRKKSIHFHLDAQIRACMCLGNILKDMPEHPGMYAGGVKLLKQILAALNASMQGKQYPYHSKSYHILWQVLVGCSNLVRNKQNQKVFLEIGILPTLADCINLIATGENPHPKVRKYALECMLNLSEAEEWRHARCLHSRLTRDVETIAKLGNKQAKRLLERLVFLTVKERRDSDLVPADIGLPAGTSIRTAITTKKGGLLLINDLEKFGLNTEKELGKPDGCSTIYESDWNTTKEVAIKSKWRQSEPDAGGVNSALKRKHRLRSKKSDKASSFLNKTIQRNEQTKKKQRNEQLNKELKKSHSSLNQRSTELSQNESRLVQAYTLTPIKTGSTKKKGVSQLISKNGKYWTQAVGRPKGYFSSREYSQQDLNMEGVLINRLGAPNGGNKAKIRKQRKRKHRQVLLKNIDRSSIKPRKNLLKQFTSKRLPSFTPENRNSAQVSTDDDTEIVSDTECVDMLRKRTHRPKPKNTPKRQEKLWKLGKRSKFLVVVHPMNSSPLQSEVTLSEEVAKRWKPIISVAFPGTPSSKLRVHCIEGFRDLDMQWTDPGLM